MRNVEYRGEGEKVEGKKGPVVTTCANMPMDLSFQEKNGFREGFKKKKMSNLGFWLNLR